MHWCIYKKFISYVMVKYYVEDVIKDMLWHKIKYYYHRLLELNNLLKKINKLSIYINCVY